MIAYLLDTDWAIQAMAGQGDAIATIEQLASAGIAVAWVTIAEIYEGAYRYPEPHIQLAAFREFLRQFPILDFNDAIMEHFAETRSDLRRRGEMISDFDILLAATALHYDLTILTYNVRHFRRIPNVSIYRATPL